MKPSLLFVLLAMQLPSIGFAVETMTITVTNDLEAARPAETVEVPWSEIAKRLPGTLPSHILIKDADGAAIPQQLINTNPEEHQDNYECIIFQHDFAAGEKTATFTLERTDIPVPPYPAKTFARYVPERFDDLAWENDRIAYRIYGPALATPTAGKSQVSSSGIDVWCKRVRYPIIDRWYSMGHYHEDTGEGIDTYDVGGSRGCGGVGIWNGRVLRVSRNWQSWKVLANGPLRVIFKVSYEPWDAGDGVMVSESRRVTLDAGSNLSKVESVFEWVQDKSLPCLVGIGLGKHPKKVEGATFHHDEEQGWFSLWEKYPKHGQLGTALIVPGGVKGAVEDDLNYVALTEARSGEPLHYCIGAGWDRSGDFSDQKSWETYLSIFARRLKSPLVPSYTPTN